MKIKTSLGDVIIRKNSPFYGGSATEYAATQSAIRAHKRAGGRGNRAFARLDSYGKDGSEYWQVDVFRPLDQNTASIEKRYWVTTYAQA